MGSNCILDTSQNSWERFAEAWYQSQPKFCRKSPVEWNSDSLGMNMEIPRAHVCCQTLSCSLKVMERKASCLDDCLPMVPSKGRATPDCRGVLSSRAIPIQESEDRPKQLTIHEKRQNGFPEAVILSAYNPFSGYIFPLETCTQQP